MLFASETLRLTTHVSRSTPLKLSATATLFGSLNKNKPERLTRQAASRAPPRLLPLASPASLASRARLASRIQSD